MRAARLTVLTVIVSAVVAVPATADQFVHLEVVEDRGARVAINLPLDAAVTGLGMIPADLRRHGHIHLDGTRVDRE